MSRTQGLNEDTVVIEAVVSSLEKAIMLNRHRDDVHEDEAGVRRPRQDRIPEYVSIGPRHWRVSSGLQRVGLKLRSLEIVADMAQNLPSLRQQLSRAPGLQEQGLTRRHYLAHLAGQVLSSLRRLLGEENGWRNEECYGFRECEGDMAGLVKMMLLDGCFLLYKFGGVAQMQGQAGSPETSSGQGQQGHTAGLESAAEVVQSPQDQRVTGSLEGQVGSPVATGLAIRSAVEVQSPQDQQNEGSAPETTTGLVRAAEPRPPQGQAGSPETTTEQEMPVHPPGLQHVGSSTSSQGSPLVSHAMSPESTVSTGQEVEMQTMVDSQAPAEQLPGHRVNYLPSSSNMDERRSRRLDGSSLSDDGGEPPSGGHNNGSRSGSGISGAVSTTPLPSLNPSRREGGAPTTPMQQQQEQAAEDPYRQSVVRDTWFLLENQMPFQVVETIYEAATGRSKTECRNEFKRDASAILKEWSYIVADPPPPPPPSGEGPCPWDHLLGLLRILLQPTEPRGRRRTDDSSRIMRRWRGATDYVECSNVWFVQRDLDDGGNGAGSVLDVSMAAGEVRIPRLFLDRHTCTVLHNLVALEQQRRPLRAAAAGTAHHSYVTDYCLFMRQLACTAQDVERLLRDGVIDHDLGGPQTVADRLGAICRGINYDNNNNYLQPIWRRLEARYTSPWHRACSRFRIKYGSLPGVLALIGASLLLVSAVASAVFQVLSYLLPTKMRP